MVLVAEEIRRERMKELKKEEYEAKVAELNAKAGELFEGRVVLATAVWMGEDENSISSAVNILVNFKGRSSDYVTLHLNILKRMLDAIRKHCPPDKAFISYASKHIMDHAIETAYALSEMDTGE